MISYRFVFSLSFFGGGFNTLSGHCLLLNDCSFCGGNCAFHTLVFKRGAYLTSCAECCSHSARPASWAVSFHRGVLTQSRMTCGHAEWDRKPNLAYRHILYSAHKQDRLMHEPKQYTPICWSTGWEETCCHGECMDVWISVWQWHFLGHWFTCAENQLLAILRLWCIYKLFTWAFNIQHCVFLSL